MEGDGIFFLDLTLFTNLECDTPTAIYEPISAISIFTRSLRRHACDFTAIGIGIDSWPTWYLQRPYLYVTPYPTATRLPFTFISNRGSRWELRRLWSRWTFPKIRGQKFFTIPFLSFSSLLQKGSRCGDNGAAALSDVFLIFRDAVAWGPFGFGE